MHDYMHNDFTYVLICWTSLLCDLMFLKLFTSIFVKIKGSRLGIGRDGIQSTFTGRYFQGTVKLCSFWEWQLLAFFTETQITNRVVHLSKPDCFYQDHYLITSHIQNPTGELFAAWNCVGYVAHCIHLLPRQSHPFQIATGNTVVSDNILIFTFHSIFSVSFVSCYPKFQYSSPPNDVLCL